MRTYKGNGGEPLTARELAERIKRDNPALKIGYANDGAAMGWFADGRWWVYASGSITGYWVRVDGQMPLVNGKQPYPDDCFTEVLPEVSLSNIGLCPICGCEVRLTGQRTTNGRLIGSCGDAFTVAQWND